MITEDIEIDDSYLHRKAEEITRKINEENKKMAREMYEELMEYLNSKA